MNPLTRYLRVIEALAALAVVAGICWGAHEFLEHERDIGRNEVRAEYAKQLADAKDAAAKQEKDWRDRYDAAINQGAKNAQALQVAATAAAASSSSLRDTIATISNRLPSATAEASRAYASTLATVLGECEGRYRAMGQAAQGHFGDASTLDGAWPTNANQKDTR